MSDPGAAEERLGTVQQAVTNLGNEHDYLQIPAISISNLSTDWIPGGDTHGRILATFTDQSEGTGAWYGYTADNNGPGLINWQHGGPSGYIGAQFPWDDPNHPWPEPSNQCDIYDCSVTNFVEYTAAVKALSTDHLDTAVIIAVARTTSGLADFYDVVAVTSIDGGVTFTDARIISTGSSGGHDRTWANRVDATTVVTTEVGSERDRDSTAAQIVTWYGGDPSPPNFAAWWGTKVLVDPDTGHVNLLNEPVQLPFGNDTGRVSVAAYEDHMGLENVVLINSARSTATGGEWTYSDSIATANDGLADCPSTDRFTIQWRYSRAIGVFDHSDFDYEGGLATINFEVDQDLIDMDEAWKPCVGPSDAGTGAPNYYVNDDRAVVVVNRRPRATVKAAWVKTEPESGLARIRMMDRGLATGTWPDPPSHMDTFWVPAPEEAEEYNPEVEIGQGSLTNGDPRRSMRFALSRKRVAGALVSIEGRSEEWTISYSGTSFTASKGVSDANLSRPVDPTRFEGTTLGLTVQPLCYHDTYGSCLTSQPERLFHAAYPRLGSNVVRGIAFEH